MSTLQFYSLLTVFYSCSLLSIFVDGAKRLECPLKYPALNGEPVSYCQIGSPLQRGNVPALNVHEQKQSFKDGIMDAIKVGIPGVINLPGSLKPGGSGSGGSNDPNVRWTLIGLEDQLWGRSVSLSGQLGAVSCFQDAITPSQAKLLYSSGPNHGLAFSGDDAAGGNGLEAADILNRVVFYFSARASHGTSCPNLQDPAKYEAQVLAQSFSTQDVKDVVNCIGGVQALFPLLETAAASSEEEAVDTGYLSLRDASDESLKDRRSSIADAPLSLGAAGGGDEWELVPSSSFSDWKLEQNAISGFLTLVKNLVSGHTVNKEQLMRGGGVAIIGSLLQEARSALVDVNVLMACQLLVELAQSTGDQRLLYQIYHSVLFDFRIWSRSEFHVQIGHIQYLSTIIKDDRKFFRRKFGVQFFLDIIRRYYSGKAEGGGGSALSPDDLKTLRASLFGLVKFFLQRDVTSRDVHPLVAFMLAERNEVLLKEVVEMLSLYLENRQAKDQVFLIMYERKRADLLCCQLLQKEISPAMRRTVLRLITVLLRTNRISLRHKYRMHLAEVRYLGFLHLWFKKAAKGDCAAVTKEEVLILLDQMLLFDQPVSYQGVLGLVHHLQWSDTVTKLEVARRIMTCLFAKPDVPANFAKQIGWQECLTRLLVKKMIKPDLNSDVSIDESLDDGASNLSPTHLIEVATSTAKQYLPQPAGDALELVSSKVGAVVSGTQKKVASNVNYVSSTVQATSDAVASKTQQILGKVHSGLEDLRGHGQGKRRNSAGSTSSEHPPEQTPHYLQAYDQFGFEDLTLEASAIASSSNSRSPFGSTDDVSTLSRADTACSTPTRSVAGGSISEDIPDIEVVNAELDGAEAAVKSASKSEEEELCQLVINILFTVMWRGLRGAGEEVIRERGQVIACINMLGLNNELFRSHVELKRRLIEQCVQAVLSDHREVLHGSSSSSPAAAEESRAVAAHVMQWVYDLVVLDRYTGDFGKKVTESLLDGVLALVELLVERQQQQSRQQQQQGSEEDCESMSKMAVDVLLKCAEDAGDVGIRTMATAKLHGLVLTRSSSPSRENAYLISKVATIIQSKKGEIDESLSCLAPVLKALLDKSRDQLHVGTQLPSVNLRLLGEEFLAEILRYFETEEWKYFLEKKLAPLSEEYRAGFLTDLPREMDVFWAECYEQSKVAAHRRSREVGESKLRFQAKYLDPYGAAVRAEWHRQANGVSQLRSHLGFIRKRWCIGKRLYFGPRGAWLEGGGTGTYDTDKDERWKLAPCENHLRMRVKLVPNQEFDPHEDASLARDNVKSPSGPGGQAQVLQMQISKEALKSREDWAEDGLTEEDLKAIAKEQMVTAASAAGAAEEEGGGDVKAGGGGAGVPVERLVMAEDCELVTLMSVVKGKMEVTTAHAYFFDTSPYKEGVDRHDFRFPLSSLREMHLRRFNLRRSGIEFFLVDQTNYFLNFASTRLRNRVFSRLSGMRLPSLVSYGSSRSSPAELLKASGLTQRWCNREISNFEYLMHLNTIAGRSFNDLSQYPVFPWVLRDYESKTLDLTRSEVFRDLSKPVGVQNKKHEEEVRSKYEAFEDPSGTIAKFHYGTHYSNSAMVLHYLVRVEPFTSLHIELQSGRYYLS